MNSKKRNYLKSSESVARFSRLMAKAIDLGLVFMVSLLLYPVGVILSVVYLCFSDSLQNGQSLGKRIIGFCVISLEDGSPCSVKQSIIRNLPFIIPTVFAIFPFWGWLISLGIGFLLVLPELYFLYKIDSGHRFGDVLADTSVIAQDGGQQSMAKKGKSSWFEASSNSRPSA